MADPQLLARMYHAVMSGIVRDGRAPHYTELATELGLSLEQAREAYADAEGIDEATLLAAIEEHARDGLRRDYPLLTAATLWDLVHR